MKLLVADCWFFEHGEKVSDLFDTPPAQTLQPGQETVFGFKEPGFFSTWDAAAIAWGFTDVDGGKYRADYHIDTSGNPFAYSLDAAPDGSFVLSSATFHMESANDSFPNDIAAVLSHPAEGHDRRQHQPRDGDIGDEAVRSGDQQVLHAHHRLVVYQHQFQTVLGQSRERHQRAGVAAADGQ
jgi:hypothetical protein